MLAIKGVYDGKVFKALPTENIPVVSKEVPIAIIFLDDKKIKKERYQYQRQIVKRMRAARAMMPLLGLNIKDLVEEGRER